MSVATCCRARFLMPFLMPFFIVIVGLDGGLELFDGDAKKHDIDGDNGGDDGGACCCCFRLLLLLLMLLFDSNIIRMALSFSRNVFLTNCWRFVARCCCIRA